MAVWRINAIINKLDWREVRAHLYSAERDDADPGFEVCEASFQGWEKYVTSERQALKSRAMTFEGGRIYIVELPSDIHDCFNGFAAMLRATETSDEHLVLRRSIFVADLRHIEPDCSYGPEPGFGAILPAAGMMWPEYHTLKVEVGVSRGWSILDPKADEWRQFPGVEYILCIRISPGLQVRQYKLYSVDNRANPLPQLAPIDIENNPTIVEFNSLRLFGLVGRPEGLPQGFARPNVVINLFPLVQRLIRHFIERCFNVPNHRTGSTWDLPIVPELKRHVPASISHVNDARAAAQVRVAKRRDEPLDKDARALVLTRLDVRVGRVIVLRRPRALIVSSLLEPFEFRGFQFVRWRVWTRAFEVCEASCQDWESYVTTENQCVKSRAMAYEGGCIYIVEPSSGTNQSCLGHLSVSVMLATGAFNEHLASRGSSYVESRQKLEPDCSFGPEFDIGAVRPAGMTWLEFHTLKVEWRAFPGVECVLCIRLPPTLELRQYKLYTVDDRASPLPPMDPIDIVDPTNVAFDSRQLLGLVGRGPLPPGFAQPNVVVDLFPLVQRLLRDIE